jgi:hypothetical protein
MLNIDHARAFPTDPRRNKPRQGTLIIKASTKKEACEKLAHLGYRWMKPHELRVGMGNSLEALEDAGLLDSGDLFIVADYGEVVRVSVVDGEDKAKYIGKIRTKPVFAPAEEGK